MLILGVVLSIFGRATKVRQDLKKAKSKQRQRQRHSNLNNNSYVNEDAHFKNDIVKKDFIAEQFQHKTDQFINSQEGQLKELAMKVDWTPLAGGGANFKTSSLKRVNSSRLEVVKSTGGLMFAGLFAVVGLGVMFGVTYIMYKDEGLSWELLFPVLFGSVFATVGLAMLYWPRPRIFDLRQGWFWVGNKSLLREQEFIKLKKSARLSEIKVIQVISERISGSKRSYTSWEINLVSKDGQRMNAMDHGNQQSIIDDAQLLGEFLDVPVWENV